MLLLGSVETAVIIDPWRHLFNTIAIRRHATRARIRREKCRPNCEKQDRQNRGSQDICRYQITKVPDGTS